MSKKSRSVKGLHTQKDGALDEHCKWLLEQIPADTKKLRKQAVKEASSAKYDPRGGAKIPLPTVTNRYSLMTFSGNFNQVVNSIYNHLASLRAFAEAGLGSRNGQQTA